jgi:hypothetical protein
MASDNKYSQGGAVLIKTDEQSDLNDYKEMVCALSIEEFVELTTGYDLNKSFDPRKTAFRKQKLMEYFQNWVKSDYHTRILDSINSYTDVDSELVEWVSDTMVKQNLHSVMSYKRNESIYMMLHYITNIRTTGKSDTTCTVFGVKKSGVKTTTNYAYLYSITKAQGVGHCMATHLYYCIGPNMVSSDGEYRNKFSTVHSLDHVMVVFKDIWRDVEEYLLHKPKLSFCQNYYTHDSDSIHILKDSINSNRLAINLFILAWINQAFMFHLKLDGAHIDGDYKNNMFDAEDNLFMQQLIEAYTVQRIRQLYAQSGYIHSEYTSKSITKQQKWNNPRMGQKIIPLSEEEQKYGGIQYPAWREFYICEKVSDLVLNYICPGVSFTHDWFYINAVDKKLFNNPNIVNRMALLNKNNMARRATRDIHIVSDSAINILSEYTGRPINDVALLLKSKEYNRYVGNMFESPDKFFRYMFDITYALLCVNSKLNIIHGDLHLNNTTIHNFDTYYIDTYDIDTYASYFINNTLYQFKNTGHIGTIIDFGRSLLIPPDHLFIHIKDEQIERILRYYIQLFPEFHKIHGDKLKNRLESDFISVFKLFTAIDMYVHTDRLLKYIEKHSILNTHAKIKKLCSSINTETLKYLTSDMKKLLDGEMTLMQYPNLQIINKFFSQYIVKNKNKNKLSDVYFYENELTYSLSVFDKVPLRFKEVYVKKDGDIKAVKLQAPSDDQIQKLKLYYTARTQQSKTLI